MTILEEIENVLNEFNENNKLELSIDSIRVVFNKEHKLKELEQLGKWKKLQKNSDILHKLKNRLAIDEVTSAYQLEKQNIYFYNKKDITKKYRKAEMVIFGMKQYHKEAPAPQIVEKILNILTFGRSKNNGSIDLCFDMKDKPSIYNLKAFFDLYNFRSKSGAYTETFYINDTYNDKIENICIYDKRQKNSLTFDLWRIEAKILISNMKCLELPLNDFKNVIEIAKG